MGVFADTVLSGGGKVIGVITRGLFAREIGHQGIRGLRVVQSMHEGKEFMASLAAGFMALPGGVGTLEEIFEQWAWS